MPLLFIVITLALLGGFFVLTSYEIRRGARVWEAKRARLDQGVERIQFLLHHVDLGAFLRDEIRHGIAQVSHGIVHISLQVVRAAERLLTRLVRYLRSRQIEDTTPRENVREFVKTLSDFKNGLKDTRPEVTEIQ